MSSDDEGMTVAAHLVEIDGYTPGRDIELGDVLVLGRDPGPGGVVIANREASRRHARVYRRGEQYFVEDLGSSNGTFVDGKERKRSALREGMTLTIGRTTFRFTLHPGETMASLGGERRAGEDRRSADRRSAEAFRVGDRHGRVSVDGGASGRGDGGHRAPVWNLTMDAREADPVSSTAVQPAEDSEALRRERDNLNILCEISRTLGSVLDLEELSQQILHKLFELFPAAEKASIHRLSAGKLVPIAARTRAGGAIPAPAISQTIASMTLAKGQSILSTDAAEDARFVGKQSIILQKVRSFMCSPMVVKDESLGVLYVDTTDARPRFTRDDLVLFTAVSAQMAVAVKNTQLVAANMREAEVRLHLSRYLPPDLVEQVIHHQIDLNPGGSLCRGTVLFSDVVGFTPMSEALEPGRLVQHLNAYFELMVDIVFRHRGSVNAFGGDSLLTLWGVPVSRGRDALNACRAALEMHNMVFGFNQRAEKDGCPAIRIGIGINTGSFVVGNIGSARHMQYTALGREVNLAQRVESQASAWQVFASESAFREMASDVVAFRLPPRRLKGVADPKPIYSLRAVRDDESGALLCSIPARVEGESLSADAMIVGYREEGEVTFWAPLPLEPGHVLLEIQAPETLGGVPITLDLLEVQEIPSFRYRTPTCWAFRGRLLGERPPLFACGRLLDPAPGREYLPRR